MSDRVKEALADGNITEDEALSIFGETERLVVETSRLLESQGTSNHALAHLHSASVSLRGARVNYMAALAIHTNDVRSGATDSHKVPDVQEENKTPVDAGDLQTPDNGADESTE